GDLTGHGYVGGRVGPLVGNAKGDGNRIAGAYHSRRRYSRSHTDNAQVARRSPLGHKRINGSTERGSPRPGQRIDDRQRARGGIAGKISVLVEIDRDAGTAIHSIAAEIGDVRANSVIPDTRRRINLGKERVLRSVQRGLNCAGRHWEVYRIGRPSDHYVAERSARRIQYSDSQPTIVSSAAQVRKISERHIIWSSRGAQRGIAQARHIRIGGRRRSHGRTWQHIGRRRVQARLIRIENRKVRRLAVAE